MAQLLSPTQRDTLLSALEQRFRKNQAYHPGLSWESVQVKLTDAPDKLASLHVMEETGGEPNVVPDPEHPTAVVFMDCAAESPAQRRNLCYDGAALASRRQNPPKDSAEHMAATMRIELLSEAQYRALQTIGEFDLKTSSWVKTPIDVREKGGALFCDKRYGRVFVYHNGADSYYSSRGFRGFIIV